MHKITAVDVRQFSLSLIINYTVGGQNNIKKLNFDAKADNATTTADNGAAFDILISNDKRKRLATNEAWFDFDHWQTDGMALKYDGADLQSQCQNSFPV